MGSKCLNQMNDQFALAIWDVKQRTLFLARDRMGIRPLYYTQVNDQFVFASEIKAILQHPEVTREIDPYTIQQIFTFWTPLPGRSVFKNIFELKPGHHMMIRDSQIKEQAYWDVPFCTPESQTDSPIEMLCDELQEILLDAVRIRFRADVPVGSYLSGGLDSSLITALISHHFNHDIQTFGH